MQQEIFSIPLCSRCATYEINSWANEKWKELDEETSQSIRQELKAIRLKQGECIVCKNNYVAENCFENILKILEKSNNKKLTFEFKKLFGLIMSEKLNCIL